LHTHNSYVIEKPLSTVPVCQLPGQFLTAVSLCQYLMRLLFDNQYSVAHHNFMTRMHQLPAAVPLNRNNCLLLQYSGIRITYDLTIKIRKMTR